ncbi:MAG TPA: retropepsin-like aspartic protease [Pyrinomonadaceae bacterium]|nr:retropepsin-like aspartic protease [Pyrinomonadaceae bacterium]
MNQRLLRSIGATFTILLLVVPATAKFNQQTDENAAAILNRMSAALGGLEKLRAIEGIYMRGKVDVAGLSGTVEDWQTAAGQHKQIVDLGDVYKQITIFNGTRGWVIDRNNQISDMAGLSLEKEILASYLGSFSHLVSGRLGGKVTSAGEDTAGKYYLLRVQPERGSVATYTIDKSTFLPISLQEPSEDGSVTTYFEDWRDVDGVKMPFRIRQNAANPANNAVVQQESIKFTSIAATNFVRPESGTPDFRFTNGRRFARMPLGRDGYAIFVQARLNNSQPLWFVLDTGASVTVIDARRARALGLKSAGNVAASAPGGHTAVQFTKGVNFTLPGVRLTNQTVVSVPFRKEFSEVRRNLAGILGYDFISRFVMEIDYLNQTLTLYDAKTYQYQGPGKRVPISIDGTPFVRAEVKTNGHDPVAGRFEIDTGYDGAITLYQPFVKAHPELTPPAQSQHDKRQGVGQTSDSVKAPVELFRLGEFSFPDVAANFTVGEEGVGGSQQVAGLIGNELLSKFKVIFDYSRQEMVLEPNPQPGNKSPSTNRAKNRRRR